MWLLKGEKCGIASTTSWLLSTSATASISSLPSWTPSGIALVRKICQNLGNTEYSKSMYGIFEGDIISLTLMVMRSNAAIRPLMRIVWNEKFCKKHLWDSPVSKFQSFNVREKGHHSCHSCFGSAKLKHMSISFHVNQKNIVVFGHNRHYHLSWFLTSRRVVPCPPSPHLPIHTLSFLQDLSLCKVTINHV